jgi:hypothetical protein
MSTASNTSSPVNSYTENPIILLLTQRQTLSELERELRNLKKYPILEIREPSYHRHPYEQRK